MIEIKDVTKQFHSLLALDKVTISIGQGEVLGVLGPNGAGKTTLFKVIAGLLNPDSGKLTVNTSSWPAIGYKPERLLFPNKMRVSQYLKMIATLANIDKPSIDGVVASSLDRLNLTYASEKKIKDCSKGMRQRLALAQAMMGDPPILLLDEPSNGLDPDGQNDICRHIKALNTAGRTVVLASHHLEEVTRVCTYIVIMNQGRIHYENSMEKALAEKPKVVIKIIGDVSPARTLLETFHPNITVDENEVVLLDDAIPLRRQVLRILLNAGFDVSKVEHKRVTLAEIYSEAVS